MPSAQANGIKSLIQDIVDCEACPRLRRHCGLVAKEKRRAYAKQEYWGRPIPGFGDPQASLVIVGLAPAAHGANRTGRIFTGDRSGDWLYRALFRAGFATQPESLHRDDRLELRDAYVSCVVRCAPPDNKPLPAELARCGRYLERELDLLSRARVYLALGKIAHDGLWPILSRKFGLPRKPRPAFSHGASHQLQPGRWLLLSYHPSQQNTFTGRLTEPMFDSVFRDALSLLGRRRLEGERQPELGNRSPS